MTQLPVPHRPQNLTPDWLAEALRSTGAIPDVPISDIAIERVGAGSGFVGECVRITPTYGLAASLAPSSMVAKFPSPENVRMPSINSAGPHGREVRFYAELADKVSITTPEVYYSAFDEGSGNYVLIMEDMSHAQVGDDMTGRPDEDALFSVRQLARMHAEWWDESMISKFPGQHQTSDERQRNFRHLWRLCVQQVGADLSTPFITVCNILTERIGEISSALARRPQTLIHGDFRYDNMFFSQDGGAPHITLFDWALVERACAAYDVSYFVASSLHVHQRREMEESLLTAYHDALMEHGIRGYSPAELLNDYRLSFSRFVELWVEAGAYLDLTNPRGHAYFLESIIRLDTILEDHDIPHIIERRLYA